MIRHCLIRTVETHFSPGKADEEARRALARVRRQFMEAKLVEMDINVGNNVDYASCGALMKSPCTAERICFIEV